MNNTARMVRSVLIAAVAGYVLTWNTSRLSSQAAGATLAFVVDDTGSMIDDIAWTKDSLTGIISDIQNNVHPFPLTAFITFKDDVATPLVTSDPVQLQAKVDLLVATGGGDCPESSNQALITTAGLMASSADQPIGFGNQIYLYTDADSRPDGPDSLAVTNALLQKNLSSNAMVSNDCQPGGDGVSVGSSTLSIVNTNPNHDSAGSLSRTLGLWAAPLASGLLGVESGLKTFSTLASVTHGTFAYIPEVKDRTTTDGGIRYRNASTNLILSSFRPTVTLVTPGVAPQGSEITVEISGGRTSFQRSSVVSVAGNGVTVLSRDVTSPTRIVARLSVAADAATGFRDVTVTTNLGAGTVETALGTGSLQIAVPSPAPKIVSASPTQLTQGARADVTISGTATHFAAGSSAPSFGDGITVNSVTVSNATSLTASVTVARDAAVNARSVTVTTGSETATDDGHSLFVAAAPAPAAPRLVRVLPARGVRGTEVSITVQGENTHFDKTTTVTLGSGMAVKSVTVNSPTTLVAVVDVSATAPLGFKGVTVTTGSEIVAIFDAFNVVTGTTHDLVVDFGPMFNLLLRSGATGTWMPFFPLSPKSLVTGDLDGNGIDEVIADFGPRLGIWIWFNDSYWVRLDRATANRLVTADLDGNGEAELIVDYPGAGIWVYFNNASWVQLTDQNSRNIIAGDLDGNGKQELIIDFPGEGISIWLNNASWSPLHRLNARNMVADDFDGDGRDELVVDFDGFGVRRFSLETGWVLVLPVNPVHLAAGDLDGNGMSDLIVDLGRALGIWVLQNGTEFTQLDTRSSQGLLTSDLDGDGKADLVIKLGPFGLWEYSEKTKLVQLHSLKPGVMAAGHVKEP